MKTTIITGFVVVVIGLNWMLIQPSANTTTRSGNTHSFRALILSYLPVKKNHHGVHQSEASYYTTQHLNLNVASGPYRYKNLQLYPIVASPAFMDHHRPLGPYLSLRESLDQNKLLITELSAPDTHVNDTSGVDLLIDDARVNRLFIEISSSDTIIVLGGEVIQGGKQDRMIARDFLVSPHSGKIDVAVYCVEHGRWTDQGDAIFFSVTPGFAPASVREIPPSEQYAQERVWEEVADLQMDIKIKSSTEALATVMVDEAMNEIIDPYRDYFTAIQWPTNVVGVIAVAGNDIVGCDMFAQHELFKKYYSDLVSSYCGKVYQTDNNVVLPVQDVQSFFNGLLKNEASLENHLSENGTQLKHKHYRLHVAAY